MSPTNSPGGPPPREAALEADRAQEMWAEEGQAVGDDEVSVEAIEWGGPGAVLSPGNDYQLDDNVVADLVDYIRSSTIRNEEQFVLLTLAYTTGLFDDTNDYVSSVVIGTSSSGKTHVKAEVDRLFTHLDVMDASTGSDKSLVYDDEWDDADVISMGELQQPPEEMLEFLKRAHGGDEEVVVRSTRGNPAEGFETEKIVKRAKSYHFSYAQMDADFEFWNRLLKVPVHESESKNKAVGRLSFGHEDVGLGDGPEYGYEFSAGAERLQAHFLEMKRRAPKRVVLPNGGGHFTWDVWEIVEPIFNHSRSESNRVYRMLSNLIKASALINYQNRDTMTVRINADEGPNVAQAIVAEAQDVANVLRCIDTLRATTHEIGPRKRAVVEAIRAKSNSDGEVDGLEPIVEFLEESDASSVKQSELEAILKDLEDNHLIVADGSTYRARNWDALGEPRVEQHAHLFEVCIDPIDGTSFLEAWARIKERNATTAGDLLEGVDVDSAGADLRVDTEDVAEAAEAMDADLEDWQLEVCSQIKAVLDDRRVSDLQSLPVEGFLGLTPIDAPDVAKVDSAGTLLDPDHSLWNQSDKPDEWVTTETDARINIQETIGQLIGAGMIRFAEVHNTEEDGTVVDATIAVGR